MVHKIVIPKLDFDKLYDEAEKAGRVGECPLCEFDGDTSGRVLCWCGVCLKYHHDDHFHETLNFDEYLPELT